MVIHVSDGPKDANDGRLFDNPPRIGNRTYGQRILLSGTERPIDTAQVAYDWYDFETLTVSTTALSLTAAMSARAAVAFITVETQAVRYRLDGQNPTASVGHALLAGDVLELDGFWEIDKFRVIRRDGADSTLRVSYGVRRYE